MNIPLTDRDLPACSSGPGRPARARWAGARVTWLALPSAILMVAAGAAVLPAAPALAAVACSAPSLVSAISSANSTGGTVTLASGCTYTLTAADNGTDGGTGLPVITGKVTVQGSGATIQRSTASGTAAFRLFDIASGGSLTLNGGLTLGNGLADDGANGGGAIDSHGTLSVSGVTFSGNQSPAATGTSGGAIDSSGTLTVTNSTFTGNTAQEGGGIFSQQTATITNTTFTGNSATIYGGGGLLNAAGSATVTADMFSGNSGPGGGAIDNDASLKISDSTFTGNSAGNNGGGAIQNFGTTTVTQSTVAGNSSPYGANVLNYTGFSLTLTMSIVAGGQVGPNCGGMQPVTDGGYNIDTGSTCGFSTASHSMSNTQPQLGPLASNGGPTQTMALPAGSPAVDAIPAATTGCTGSTDQRGVSRPQGSGCDVGAYELVVTSGTAPSTPTGLTATKVTANSVSLAWNPSTGPSGVTGYTVYRNGTQVGTTGGRRRPRSPTSPSRPRPRIPTRSTQLTAAATPRSPSPSP
jgi:predicted outer membrane repeat protein